jgi:hypothetical protein
MFVLVMPIAITAAELEADATGLARAGRTFACRDDDDHITRIN